MSKQACIVSSILSLGNQHVHTSRFEIFLPQCSTQYIGTGTSESENKMMTAPMVSNCKQSSVPKQLMSQQACNEVNNNAASAGR